MRISDWSSDVCSSDLPFNFSVGANYTWFKTIDEYIIMSNVFTALAMSQPLNQTGDQTTCAYSNFLLAPALPLAPIRDSFCVYIDPNPVRPEEHTSELQSLMRISYAVFCLKKKTNNT